MQTKTHSKNFFVAIGSLLFMQKANIFYTTTWSIQGVYKLYSQNFRIFFLASILEQIFQLTWPRNSFVTQLSNMRGDSWSYTQFWLDCTWHQWHGEEISLNCFEWIVISLYRHKKTNSIQLQWSVGKCHFRCSLTMHTLKIATTPWTEATQWWGWLNWRGGKIQFFLLFCTCFLKHYNLFRYQFKWKT